MALKRISLTDTAAIELVAEAAVALRGHRLCLSPVGAEAQFLVPEAVSAAIVVLLEELAKRHAVTVAPEEQELTTQQAADLLSVSRPYLIGLLEAGEIPFRRVGNRRKLELMEVLAFKSRDTSRREALVDQLTAEAQDLGLYD